MRFERQLDRLTGAVVLLAILTYALAARSPMIAMIGLPACIAAWIMGDQLKMHTVPRIAANALVLAAVARALYVAFQRGVRVEDVCGLVVIILVIKLFDRKNARDYAQLLTLSIFLTLGSVLTSNALLMGIVMIAMLPLIIAAATIFQLYSAWEQQIDVEGDAARRVDGFVAEAGFPSSGVDGNDGRGGGGVRGVRDAASRGGGGRPGSDVASVDGSADGIRRHGGSGARRADQRVDSGGARSGAVSA